MDFKPLGIIVQFSHLDYRQIIRKLFTGDFKQNVISHPEIIPYSEKYCAITNAGIRCLERNV